MEKLRESEYAGHQCRCRVIHQSEPDVPDDCADLVEEPDNPFCDYCEDRHPDNPEGDVITQRPLNEGVFSMSEGEDT